MKAYVVMMKQTRARPLEEGLPEEATFVVALYGQESLAQEHLRKWYEQEMRRNDTRVGNIVYDSKIGHRIAYVTRTSSTSNVMSTEECCYIPYEVLEEVRV